MTQLQTSPALQSPRKRPSSRFSRDASGFGGTAAVCQPLIKKFAESAPDRFVADRILDAVTGVYQVQDKQLFPQGSIASNLHFLVSGWAFRSQVLPNGARQITDVILPGDLCTFPCTAEEESADIKACGPASVAVINAELLADPVRSLVKHSRRKEQDEQLRRLRARLVSLGRRDARERMAYLIAEMHARLASVGLAENGEFAFPFTQEDLADILGLTPVHINRILAQLRRDDMLVISNRRVIICDLAGLLRIGGFEGNGRYGGSEYELL